MTNIPAISEKCTGALLASAIGDALGWPNELRARNTEKNVKAGDQFCEWTRRSGGRYWSHNEKILPGEYSDDTQMILAVARSIITGNWEYTFTKKELSYWLEYERGGGGALKNAAKLFKNNMFPWESKESREYFMAGGNGAAMRILPHVIVAAQKRDIDSLISDVIKNSIYTHGHPRAILGATCYAYALYYLMRKETILDYGELIKAIMNSEKIWSTLNSNVLPAAWLNLSDKHSGFNYHQVWDDTISSMIVKLEFISGSLNKGLLVNDSTVLKQIECFDKANGAGDVAILSSLYLTSKYANNPVLGIKTAANLLGADTDTIASMTGGLLGMLCGTSWIPIEWRLLQDYDCFVNIAEILLANDKVEAAKHITNRSKIQHGDWKDSPIGKIRIASKYVLPSGKTGSVIMNKMETMLGQTLYIKRFERKRKIIIEKQESVKPINQIAKQGDFLLDLKKVQELMENPLLARITFKKVLQIINSLMRNYSDVTELAKEHKVNKEVVEIVSSLMNKT